MCEKSLILVNYYSNNPFELWKKGKSQWNKFIHRHPAMSLNFENQDFEKYRSTTKSKSISFEGFMFPSGKVSFRGVDFGKGSLSFKHATFPSGELLDFSSIKCTDGRVSFTLIEVENRKVTFEEAVFRNCYINFHSASFGNGVINLSQIHFGKGRVNMILGNLGEGSLHLESCKFDGSVVIKQARGAVWKKKISLKLSSFKGPLDLSRVNFGSVPDLTFTDLSGHVGLERITYKFDRLGMWPFKYSENINDIVRLNRLKEIAEANRQHGFALQCHADEMRARRWRVCSMFESLIDLAFSCLSNYGRSILRPLVVLMVSTVLFTGVYNYKLRPVIEMDFSILVTFSLSNTIPFIPIAKDTRAFVLDEISDSNIGMYNTLTDISSVQRSNLVALKSEILFFSWLQGTVSFIFLFLLGLALRNFFRL